MIDVVDDVVLRFRAKNAASQFKGSRDLINECGQQQELGEHAKGEEFKGRRGRKKGKTLPISKLTLEVETLKQKDGEEDVLVVTPKPPANPTHIAWL